MWDSVYLWKKKQSYWDFLFGREVTVNKCKVLPLSFHNFVQSIFQPLNSSGTTTPLLRLLSPLCLRSTSFHGKCPAISHDMLQFQRHVDLSFHKKIHDNKPSRFRRNKCYSNIYRMVRLIKFFLGLMMDYLIQSVFLLHARVLLLSAVEV